MRKLLKLKFTFSPVRDDKYIIAKLKIFRKINRTTFTNNIVLIEKNHYACISAIDIDSVLKIDNKRVYPQAYLEQCIAYSITISITYSITIIISYISCIINFPFIRNNYFA